MKANNTIKLGVIIVSSLLPLYAYGETMLDNASADISKAAKDVGKVASDTTITAKIKTLLATESDIPLDISVTTTNSIVYLSGVVPTRLQANKIVETALSVDGVKDVNTDKLKIASSDSFFSDATITAKVKGKIMQLGTSNKIGANSALHVETANGEVHIFGTVTKSSDIDVIQKAVGDISGVKGVKVNIDVVQK